MQTQEKVKSHIRYQLADGTYVPGVTTILGVLAKPQLIIWANRMGLKGIDSTKYRDAMADIGTLAHKMITAHLKNEPCDTSEYSQEHIDKAETCLIKFWDWEKQHDLKGIIIETPLVSEVFGYGGMPDWYGLLDDIPELLDFKTSKAIYSEFFYQLAGYKQLVEEQGHPIERERILRIGRDEDEGFEERMMNSLDKQWQVFEHCLAIYNLLKETK